MASSSSVVEEATPPWEKLTPELTSAILQRLGAEEILMTAVKVCPTWWRLSLDPSMWRYIIMEKKPFGIPSSDLVDICRRAVDLSCGQLIGIRIKGFGSDDLLHYISQRSNQLRRLQLVNCDAITSEGVIEVATNSPMLEELHLHHICIGTRDIETIGRSCPLLKSFQFNNPYSYNYVIFDTVALTIAKSMPGLRHLQLLGDKMTDGGLEAILEGCPRLETLDIRHCFNVEFGGNLRRLCSERIKDLKLPLDSMDDYSFGTDHLYPDETFYDSEDELYDEYVYGHLYHCNSD